MRFHAIIVIYFQKCLAKYLLFHDMNLKHNISMNDYFVLKGKIHIFLLRICTAPVLSTLLLFILLLLLL